MARRTARGKMPLEWVTQTAATSTNATTLLTAIDLDLLPDEIAEIWLIDSTVSLELASGGAEGDLILAAALSLDPNTALGDMTSELDTAGATNGNQVIEDLEVFFNHRLKYSADVSGTPAVEVWMKTHDLKQTAFPDGRPMIVGSNVGLNIRFTETVTLNGMMTDVTTLYFTRRRANVSELNQVLLKRR